MSSAQKPSYIPPSDKIFNEVKEKAIDIWSDYKDERYRSHQIGRIKYLINTANNLMYIVTMFDQRDMQVLAGILSIEAKNEIRERMLAGGQPEYLIPF